jgi:hypothetical protein
LALDDAPHIASGSADGTIQVWDPERRRRTHRLTLGVPVHALCVAGGALVAGTDEGHLVLALAPVGQRAG